GAVSAIQRAATAEELEALRIKYLGRKGEIMLLTRSMGEVAAEDRPAVGAAVNDAKNAAQAALDARKTQLEQWAGPKRAAGAIDATLPGTRRPVGRRHPLSQVDEQIKSILLGLGFTYDDYPEVETEFNNFDSLGMPPWHPARDMQ